MLFAASFHNFGKLDSGYEELGGSVFSFLSQCRQLSVACGCRAKKSQTTCKSLNASTDRSLGLFSQQLNFSMFCLQSPDLQQRHLLGEGTCM